MWEKEKLLAQAISPFPIMFSKGFFQNLSKGVIVWEWVNSLLNDKFLDWFELKAAADDKSNVAEKLKFVLGRGENIVGKGENDGYQHFHLFPQCFQKASLLGLLKLGLCGKRLIA